MFKRQVTVTCQHGCSQEGQPHNVPNENVLLELLSVLLRSEQNLMVLSPGRRQMKKKMLIRQVYVIFS